MCKDNDYCNENISELINSKRNWNEKRFCAYTSTYNSVQQLKSRIWFDSSKFKFDIWISTFIAFLFSADNYCVNLYLNGLAILVIDSSGWTSVELFCFSS